MQVVTRVPGEAKIHFIQRGDNGCMLELVSKLAKLCNNTNQYIDVWDTRLSISEATIASKSINLVGTSFSHTVDAIVVDHVYMGILNDIIDKYCKNEINAKTLFNFWWNESWL